MYRPLAMGAVLLSLATPLLAEPSEPPPPLGPLEIRIPSITRKWKTPAGSSQPDITIDDIERCMGQDVGLQSEIQGLKQEQAQLESEQARLTSMHEELAQRSQSLETRRQAHQLRVDQFQADSASLARHLADIEKRKAVPAKTKQDVAQINQLVAAYNADVSKLNGLRAALLKEQGAINQTVATHNEDVARSNLLVAQFKERNAGFQGRAGRIASTSAAFKNNCAGERVLRK